MGETKILKSVEGKRAYDAARKRASRIRRQSNQPAAASKKNVQNVRQEYNQREKLKRMQFASTLLAVTPLDGLQRPVETIIGNKNADYGARLVTLNYKYDKIDDDGRMDGHRIGTLDLGNLFDSDKNFKTAQPAGRFQCLKSIKYRKYLETIQSSLQSCTQFPREYLPFLDCMRTSIVRGAETRSHTDALRGVTDNFIKIQDDRPGESKRGCLRIDKSVKYRCSVVLYKGNHYIPMSHRGAAGSEIMMIGVGRGQDLLSDDASCVTKHIFDSSIARELVTVGDLPFAVVGLLQHKNLQIIDFDASLKKYEFPLVFKMINFQSCVDSAVQMGTVKPRNQFVYLAKRDVWLRFKGWKYSHCWVGDPLPIRHHAFFRLIRYPTPSANVITVGNNINFVDHRKI
jgi:hypothetical protein